MDASMILLPTFHPEPRTSLPTEGPAFPQKEDQPSHRRRTNLPTEGPDFPQRDQLSHRGTSFPTEGLAFPQKKAQPSHRRTSFPTEGSAFLQRAHPGGWLPASQASSSPGTSPAMALSTLLFKVPSRGDLPPKQATQAGHLHCPGLTSQQCFLGAHLPY